MRYYKQLVKALGRTPTPVEKEAFAVMWSEHCGYSHTKKYIEQLPKAGIGGNAGVLSLDEDYQIVFKVESHNHPSAIEPYNGAATGVGGIIRDVLAMGARPTAILDSLHFHKVIDGIVEGIADYGNSIGVPTVGGELRISERYRYNPLVNVMAVGIAKNGEIVPSKADREGQVIVVFGGATGRDGIHGASFASEDLTGEKATKLAIQVGDPFAEKLLIEAFLEMVKEGLVEGAQDLGAGGVLSATAELASRGGFGVVVHLERLPLREPDMQPWEILLSESQERMAVVTSESKAKEVIKIAEKYLLHGAIVAEVVEEKVFRALYEEEVVMEVPIDVLTTPPYVDTLNYVAGEIPDFEKLDFYYANATEVYEQYDHMVGTDTVVPPGFGAAVMRVKGSSFYSLAIHSRADLALQDPYWGTYITVAEAVRKIVASGAEPLGITDCINYGDPDVAPAGLAAIMYALRDAANDFGVPVVSGNASLYNTYAAKPIPPTMVIGMAGKGKRVVKPKKGKVYLAGWHGFEPERERELHRAIKKATSEGVFVLAPSRFEALVTYKKSFAELGMKLDLDLPGAGAVHQMVLVFGEVNLGVPAKLVGELR